MLLLGMADGGISILRLNRPLLLSLQPGRHLAARSPSSHSGFAYRSRFRGAPLPLLAHIKGVQDDRRTASAPSSSYSSSTTSSLESHSSDMEAALAQASRSPPSTKRRAEVDATELYRRQQLQLALARPKAGSERSGKLAPPRPSLSPKQSALRISSLTHAGEYHPVSACSHMLASAQSGSLRGSLSLSGRVGAQHW